MTEKKTCPLVAVKNRPCCGAGCAWWDAASQNCGAVTAGAALGDVYDSLECIGVELHRIAEIMDAQRRRPMNRRHRPDE